MKLANAARGEVVMTLAGAPRRLCLTLGALAEIETGLKLADWRELPARLAQPSAADLALVLAALLKGGGEDGPDPMSLDVQSAAAAVAAGLAAAAL